MSRTYLDASVIIYSVEGAAPLRAKVLARIAAVEASPEGVTITSRLSRLECRVKPLREGAADLLARFEEFFTRDRLLVAEIGAEVVERATELRATHGFKTPDAIHLATAIANGADTFLTGDAALRRCSDVSVELLTP